jgi:hypothetical protein
MPMPSGSVVVNRSANSRVTWHSVKLRRRKTRPSLQLLLRRLRPPRPLQPVAAAAPKRPWGAMLGLAAGLGLASLGTFAGSGRGLWSDVDVRLTGAGPHAGSGLVPAHAQDGGGPRRRDSADGVSAPARLQYPPWAAVTARPMSAMMRRPGPGSATAWRSTRRERGSVIGSGLDHVAAMGRADGF